MKHTLPISLLLSLSACTLVGPDYRRPATSLPAAFAERDVATDAAQAVPARWWTLYNDPLLNELVEAGLERNADVKLAAARLEEAEAALRESRATLFFPLVEGEGGATRARTSRNGLANTFELGLSTSFEIDLWGRLRRAERSVREELLASRHGRDTVALTLAGAIARTYFAARSLDSQYEASQEILRAATDSVELTRKRSDAGVASILEVYQAGTLRTAASGQAKEIARQRAAIVHQLGVLTGRPDLSLPRGEVTSLPLPALPPAGLPSQLLERRPDVRQAEASLAAATERIGVARAAQLPTLSLTGSFGRESSELDSLFKAGSSVWSIGAGLVGPIIDGGRYRARTAQAEAQAKQAEAGYQRAVETAFREVSDALSNVRLAGETEVDLAQRVETARKALSIATRRYDAGYSADLEVLEAQRTLNEALLAFIRNRQAYLAYTVDLMSALGGGWNPPPAASLS